MSKKKKKVAKRNPYAQALALKIYQPKTVQSKKTKYDRKKSPRQFDGDFSLSISQSFVLPA